MIDRPDSSVSQLYSHLHEVGEEHIRVLGRVEALHFVELANDWIDITRAIGKVYPFDVRIRSLVLVYFFYVFKEFSWFQLHFLSGNYPLLGRSLRFVWEMIYRAYYADTYKGESPPDPSLDDKIFWLKEHEDKLHWSNCISVILRQVLPLAAQEAEVEEHYKRLWQDLNHYAHPSVALVSRMMGESSLFITDSFDETWAREINKTATQVFDLIWLAVISQFPQCAPELAQQEHGLVCPLTQKMLENYRAKEDSSND